MRFYTHNLLPPFLGGYGRCIYYFQLDPKQAAALAEFLFYGFGHIPQAVPIAACDNLANVLE